MNKEELETIEKLDLLTYLFNYHKDELVKRSRNSYRTRQHSSLDISNGLWNWWSQGIGGKNAIDYLVKVEGYEKEDAIEHIYNLIKINPPMPFKQNEVKRNRGLRVPKRNTNNDIVIDYLVNKRGIDQEIVDYYINNHSIYEALNDHAVIYLGYDEYKIAKFCSKRGTRDNIKKNMYGSNKQYSFRLENKEAKTLHLFESPIDMMSFQTIQKLKGLSYNKAHYVSLDGVHSYKKMPPVLEYMLNKYHIVNIVFHLDNDVSGKKATLELSKRLKEYHIFVDGLEGHKDVNEWLQNLLKGDNQGANQRF